MSYFNHKNEGLWKSTETVTEQLGKMEEKIQQKEVRQQSTASEAQITGRRREARLFS